MGESAVSINSSRGFELPRDVVVTIVPAGHQARLSKGDRVQLLQALGGNATVTTASGEMARLSPADSVEFGFIAAPEHAPAAPTGEAPAFDIDDVWAAAATVYDPEIPVDIVELGLIYKVDTTETPSGGTHVDIDMSVTAPFCGMGDILRQDLHDAVAAIPAVESVVVTMVYDPPWDKSRMSDIAKLELGMM